MLDLRLPYFYNLPIAVLLAIHVIYRIDAVLGLSGNLIYALEYAPSPLLIYLRLLLMVTPATVASVYFFKQYQNRNDVYLREAIYILAIVNFLGYFLPGLIS